MRPQIRWWDFSGSTRLSIWQGYGRNDSEDGFLAFCCCDIFWKNKLTLGQSSLNKQQFLKELLFICGWFCGESGARVKLKRKGFWEKVLDQVLMGLNDGHHVIGSPRLEECEEHKFVRTQSYLWTASHHGCGPTLTTWHQQRLWELTSVKCQWCFRQGC